MKTINVIKKTRLLIAVLLLFTLLFAGKKQNAEYNGKEKLKLNLRQDTHVLLTVNTQEINESNIESMVVLSDDRSDSLENSGNPKDFISVVEKNQKIYWSGVAKDSNSSDVVEILKIYRKTDGGSEIIDKTFKDPNKKGVVVGKIKNKKVEGLEYYNIRIMINQDSSRIYDVDPKLKMMAIQ